MAVVDDPRPLWRRIADTLRAEVKAGEWRPGARLPGEYALAERFGVNRHTLRQAIEHLEGQGVLRAEQGRGIFVPDPPLDYALGKRARFSESVDRARRVGARDMVSVHNVRATPDIALALSVPTETPLLRLDARALVDGKPAGIGSHYFPAARFPRLGDVWRAERSVTAVLRRCGLNDYSRRWTRVSAALITASDARLLEVGRGRAMLITEAINIDPDGVPIEYGHARWLSDAMTFVVE